MIMEWAWNYPYRWVIKQDNTKSIPQRTACAQPFNYLYTFPSLYLCSSPPPPTTINSTSTLPVGGIDLFTRHVQFSRTRTLVVDKQKQLQCAVSSSSLHTVGLKTWEIFSKRHLTASQHSDEQNPFQHKHFPFSITFQKSWILSTFSSIVQLWTTTTFTVLVKVGLVIGIQSNIRYFFLSFCST